MNAESSNAMIHRFSRKRGPVCDVVSDETGLSPDNATSLVRFGAVYVRAERANLSTLVEEGDYLRVHLRPKRFLISEVNWSKRIVFEDEECIIVDKPSGLPVHPTVDNVNDNLAAHVSHFLRRPVFVTQRIDVPTRGLVVLAKTKAFQSWFNTRLAQRAVTKRYRAWVEAPITPARYTHYMDPNPRAPKEVSRCPWPGWMPCELEVLSCNPDQDRYLLLISLLTGRSHQIRAQLAHLGSPVVGDTFYRRHYSNDFDGPEIEMPTRIELESYSISFQSRCTQIQISCSLP